MKTDRNNKFIAALMCIVLGFMFIILKGNVINAALTIIGILALPDCKE